MPLPRWVARFNKRYTNRFIEPIVRRNAGFAVVHHRGRTSGRRYTTPINVFEDAAGYVVALTYGPSADWVRNVLAGDASLEIQGRFSQIEEIELIGRSDAWPALPWFVRPLLRVLTVRDFLRLSVRRTA